MMQRFQYTALALLCLPVMVHAGLGGTVDPWTPATAVVITQAQASNQATSPQLYHVTVLQDAAGNLIHEYTALNGVVFAVSWEGPTMPDLHQLFGSYFQTYVTQLQGNPSLGQHSRVIQSDQLVVLSEGHLRHFHGKAYVPALLPIHVSINDLP